MKIFFVSLGCDKNLVDSEMMLGLLDSKGHSIIDDENLADVIIVNTCSFIHDAMEESINTIIEMGQLKETGNLKALIVTGCLAERFKDEIFDEMPEIDAILGTNSFDEILNVIDDITGESSNMTVMKSLEEPVRVNKRLLSTGGHFAYLKIAEGCNKRCTYCVIPSIRGNYRSFPIESLVEEARSLVEGGVKELILVAQETTLYGVDLYGKKSLSKLLRELNDIEDLEWIRLLYCYPEEIDDDLIQAIKECDKVCHYIDMPIQHSEDNILKKMGRRTDNKSLNLIINKLRTEIPDITIRTTLIVGFPGETDEDFDNLYEFVKKQRFDRLGAFTYSREEGTPAGNMPDQIDEEIKQERLDRIMMLQKEISDSINNTYIGKEFDVFIEGKLVDENVYVGRTYRDTPEVDGFFFVSSDRELVSGDFCRAKVLSINEYDLVGEEV